VSLLIPSRRLQLLPDTLPRGPVAEWKLLDGSGDNLADATGNGFIGQLGSAAGSDTSDPAWATYGLNPDASNDYCTMPVSAIDRPLWTVLCVAKSVATTPSVQRAFGMRYDASSSKIIVIGFGTTNQQCSFTAWNGTTTATTFVSPTSSWPNGTWGLTALSFDRIAGIATGWFVNANTIYSGQSVLVTGLTTPDIFRVGNIPTATSQPMDGGLGYVMAYPRILNDAEIMQAYRALRVIMAARGEVL